MAAHQECGAPDTDAIAGKTDQQAGQGDAHESRRGPDFLQHRLEALAFTSAGGRGLALAVEAAAQRFDTGQAQQQRGNQTGNGHPEKGAAPAIFVGNPGAQTQADQGAEMGAEHEHTHGAAALCRRVMVGNHRQRRRGAARFADRHADPGGGQLPVAAGESAKAGHHAPGGTTPGDHIAPVAPVGDAAHRHRQGRIKQGKSQAAEQTHGGVGNLEFLLHRFDQNPHDLAVDQAHRVDEGQHQQGAMGAPTGRPDRVLIHADSG